MKEDRRDGRLKSGGLWKSERTQRKPAVLCTMSALCETTGMSKKTQKEKCKLLQQAKVQLSFNNLIMFYIFPTQKAGQDNKSVLVGNGTLTN